MRSFMRILRIGVAALVLPLAIGEPGAARITAPRNAIRPQHRPLQAVSARKPAFRRNSTSECSADYDTAGYFFLGVPNGSDVAAGEYSAVLGGDGNEACDDEAGVGAGGNNVVGTEASSSFDAAGDENEIDGNDSFDGAGTQNNVSGPYSFVGAGSHNSASGTASFVGGGDTEYVVMGHHDDDQLGNQATGRDTFVGTGDLNSVSGNGSFIGGGGYTYASTGASVPGNIISGTDSFVGAGDLNSIAANQAFVGGGMSNAIAAAATYSTISGGARNSAGAQYAAVIGGYGNAATGQYAVIAGGDGNQASGTLSFAGGYHAGAVNNGSFVWSDYSSGSALVKDKAANQFVVRASGGTYVYSNEAATAGVKLAAGSGTWASSSDRNAKTDIAVLDDASILAKVATLPIDEWRYKSETGVRHVGPMAQDFYAAFGVGEDDRHITSIDEDGVALAAIKALHRENREARRREAGKDVEINRLSGDVAELRAELHRLEASVAASRR